MFILTDVAETATYDSRVPKGLNRFYGSGDLLMLLGKPGGSW